MFKKIAVVSAALLLAVVLAANSPTPTASAAPQREPVCLINAATEVPVLVGGSTWLSVDFGQVIYVPHNAAQQLYAHSVAMPHSVSVDPPVGFVSSLYPQDPFAWVWNQEITQATAGGYRVNNANCAATHQQIQNPIPYP